MWLGQLAQPVGSPELPQRLLSAPEHASGRQPLPASAKPRPIRPCFRQRHAPTQRARVPPGPSRRRPGLGREACQLPAAPPWIHGPTASVGWSEGCKG
eukprot:scaffold80831_cov72-Phaeocystis_antarctica.AAC.2